LTKRTRSLGHETFSRYQTPVTGLLTLTAFRQFGILCLPFGSGFIRKYKKKISSISISLAHADSNGLVRWAKKQVKRRKNRPCLKFSTKGENKFGRFASMNASFLSEAGIALTFLFTFCVKTKSKKEYPISY